MSNNYAKTQLFFKRLLLERVKNPDTYKDFKTRFSLDLDYDLFDDDLEYLINIIEGTAYMYNINIRLSDTLTDQKILNKLFETISLKKQFTYLSFFIKYLNDDLFLEFTNFLSKMNASVTSFKLQLKYNDKEIEEKRMKLILENLIKNDNLNIINLYIIDCGMKSSENTDLLNKFISKNKNKLKNINLYTSLVYENDFNIDVRTIKNVEISYFNLSKIRYLPIQNLNLNNNNISLEGIRIISDLIEEPNCTLRKLNLNNNYIGDEGCTILSYGLKKNKSLITLNLSRNNIIYHGLISIGIALNSKSEDKQFNSTIKKLNFSKNCIGNVALIDFCDLIKDEPEDRFIKINMQYNNITDLSIGIFGEYMQKFKDQTFLSITSRISYKNKIAYLNTCTNYTKIKKIIFENFRFDEDNSKIFNEILLKNKNIENILIYYNSFISPEDIVTMSPGIENNKNIIQVYLSQCKIGDDGAIALANALFNNINISQINLDENKIGEIGAKAISEKLLSKASLKKLILSHNVINSKGASYIGKNLAEALGIQYLFINSNEIEDEGCEYLSKGIEKNDTLMQLNINNNGITNIGIKYIAKALIGKEKFMNLSISDNKITDIEEELYKLLDWSKVVISANPLNKSGIIRLFQGTENNRLFKSLRFKILDENIDYNYKFSNKYLKDFDLSYNNKMNISLLKQVLSLKNISQLDIQSNKIGDQNMSFLLKFIKDNNIRLKSLKLQSNFIGEIGSRAIAELIKDNKYLTFMNLSSNPLGYKGIKIICNAMEEHPCAIKELILNFTQCNNYCSADIYKMLIKNKNLKVLSLIGNFLTNDGIDKILSALKVNNSLQEISIGENKNMDSKGFDNLGSYLRFNKSLISLEIKSSKMDDYILKDMTKVLNGNKDISSLNFVDNNLSYKYIVKLGLYLRKNDKIKDVKMLLNKPNKDEQNLIKSCNPHILFN